ncbi:hypothetical protein ACMHYJ_10780 [Castellaniella hirudinis]|uniref:hypothetical protein n=1 Tax=Castellaniella hirudinis TaxID=1144617 RepID=UPI0039C24F80
MSTSRRLRPLLPNEPSLSLSAAERALTEQHLLPVLAHVEACFLAVRLRLDPELRRLQPVKLGKPYPLGQCLEIARAVKKQLRGVDRDTLPAEAARGLSALRDFFGAGGSFRLVWGDLRGQFFQNAFQLGSLYVDVANDTVVPSKPKVEILPFEAANFVPITSFTQFRQVAADYWQDQIYPNHVLPELAPHCPLIHVSPTGGIKLHEATKYMLALTHADAFRPSEAVLRDVPMPAALFNRICRLLTAHGYNLPADAAQGRRLALQRCSQFRAKRLHHQPGTAPQVIAAVQQINRQLAQARFAQRQQEKPMPTLKIDDVEYDLDGLSDAAKAQLQSIQFVDQELARLQRQIAVMQTARKSYLAALKAALPS